MSYGFAELHYLLETAFDGDDVSTSFLTEVEHRTGHATSPLYAVLQEVIYAQGTATRWAAERVREQFPQTAPDADPLVLFGEMKMRPIFTEEAAMRPFAAAMDSLNAKDDWPSLYDVGRLAHNEVPVAAAVYHDDLYVPVELSLDTAGRVPHVRPWITNQYEHDGLRSDAAVFTRLHDLLTGRQ